MSAVVSRPPGGRFLEHAVASPILTRPRPAWKRTIDVSCALVGMVISAPLALLIILAIVVESPGSPFFRQTRVGHGGKLFSCWKFRSMCKNAEELLSDLSEQNEASGHIFKMKNDPRRTRVGVVLRKSSLDELPQLWNVLRGDMSLVGPRPPTPDEVASYDSRELQRLSVAPGITGLWQVTLRGRHDFADMVVLDLVYAERQSFWFDMMIMLRTVPTVLFGRGSY